MTTKRAGLRLTVVDPCREDWDGMIGGDDIRFCGRCRKNVYNLSAMTEVQVRALVQGPACVRFYARADGTVVTSKCPPLLQAARRRMIAIVACLLPVATAFWGGVVWLHGLIHAPVQRTMGVVAVPAPPRPLMGAPTPPSEPTMGELPPIGHRPPKHRMGKMRLK